MSEITNKILAVCGGIAIVGGAFAILRKWMNPAFEMVTRVEALEKCNESNGKLLEEIVQTNKMLCKSQIVLLDHEITGNGVEKIKEIKNEIQNYLIEK